MTRQILLVAVLALATPVVPAQAYAALPGSAEQQITLYELVLRDGSRLYGTIEREDPNEVVFKTQAGVLVTAKRSEIGTLKEVTGSLARGEFRPPDTADECAGGAALGKGRGDVKPRSSHDHTSPACRGTGPPAITHW